VNRNTFLFFLALSLFCLEGFGQPVYSTMDIKKPEKYENIKLGAEKTDEKKFKLPRHFIQNTVTHYNAYFNANNKLNEVIAHAKAIHRDDYSKLLSFYSYSLDATARDKRELDSIIYKCTAGILNHDLRNDWIDNLYMLMGKAYFFRKQLDTAYITFQFVNYAFSPKEKDGYDKPIGSNANSEEGGNSLIVATNEKRKFVKKVFTLPPSRNESFIWQVKTYIANGQLAEAGGLIEVLKQDPAFPPRLQNDLEEVQALLYYNQNIYDSAAAHLQKVLNKQTDKQEQSRWEYLIAQLYERSHRPKDAQEFYQRAFMHTYDPVLEVYARLNFIRQNKGSDDKLIQQNIDALLSMARKARFENYRDIIYYTAAQIELERKNKPGAISLLLKSVKYALPENNQRNKAFLQLGDLYFADKNYRPARNYYDSVDASDKYAIEDAAQFLDKRKTLDKIISDLDIIAQQDSLQRIAAMPQTERDAYIKRLAKLLRKQQGLAEEEQFSQGNFSFNNNNNGPTSLFNSGGGDNSTEWYFYNSSLKSKGFSDFKSKWGNRQNSDNWMLSSKASQVGNGGNKSANAAADNAADATAASASQISFESLMKNLPLTPEKLKKSNDSIEHTLFALGKTYQEGLPDYEFAIKTYDTLLARFPDTHFREETYFNLYYCYKKIGDEENAKRILRLMNERYPNSKFANIITYPEAYKKAAEAPKADATKKYDNIYIAFIEGRFDEALDLKKSADSVYGEKYWTPQLLYIEAVYFVRDRQDSLAKSDFNKIIQKYAGTPMAAKAKNFLDVLGRRKQIEDYLTKLKIERAKDDSIVVIKDEPVRTTLAQKPISDSLRALQKAKNDSLRLAIDVQKKNDSVKLAMAKISRLQHEMDSIQTAMLQAKSDSAKFARLKKRADSVSSTINKMKLDSAQIAKQLSSFKSSFSYNPDKPHAVGILMNKVDPVYVSETRNAFNRYNQENYYNKTFEIINVPLNDTLKLVLINGFENSDAALEYFDKVKKMAPREIVPWLPVGKYSFFIITDQNLEVLKTNKDIPAYKKFLDASYPGKF
jgi:tetratricopeptide (TPR) repeat protein